MSEVPWATKGGTMAFPAVKTKREPHEGPIQVVLYEIYGRTGDDSKTKLGRVKECIMDTSRTDYELRLWCLLVVQDRGLLLELPSHDNRYRRVGFFEGYVDPGTSDWSVSTVTIV
jgi:hypothetical protein